MRFGIVLRAINVGRHNRVRMDMLRGALEAAGFDDVRSTPWALFSVVRRELERVPNPNAIIERRWGISASTRYWPGFP